MEQKRGARKKKEAKNRDLYKQCDESEMIKIVQEIKSGMIGIRAAYRKYGLCRKILSLWITRLSVRQANGTSNVG
jgi:hypothetical protein